MPSLQNVDPARALELVEDAADRVLVDAGAERDPPVSGTRDTLPVRVVDEDGQDQAGAR